MSFEFRKCYSDNGIEFSGLYEILPAVYKDDRGYFFEEYSQKDFFAAGLKQNFVQENQSFSKKNVLRGLHFQTHNPQGKIVRTISGKIWDVAVDLRKDSATFGKYFALILDSKKKNQFYIPEGFAHGFYVLSKSAEICYKCTNFYDPAGESGILWNDSQLAINWPIAKDNNPILIEKDRKYPEFNPKADYFDLQGKWIGK